MGEAYREGGHPRARRRRRGGLLDYEVPGGDKWVFPLTQAKLFETKLVPLINAASPEDMPAFQNIMAMAFAGLKSSDAAMKHCIIISDGDPAPPQPALLDQFIAEKITISTVAINPHGGQTVDMMEGIAKNAAGDFTTLRIRRSSRAFSSRRRRR